jgi:hypothetical protein
MQNTLLHGSEPRLVRGRGAAYSSNIYRPIWMAIKKILRCPGPRPSHEDFGSRLNALAG